MQLSAGILSHLSGMGELEQLSCCFSFCGLSKEFGLHKEV